MTVYVDDMHTTDMGRYRRMKMSHMIADTDEELHAMADRIGIARRWHQDNGSGSHYDVALSKRALAVAAGAVEIPLRTLAMMNYVRRRTGELPSPEKALSVFREQHGQKES